MTAASNAQPAGRADRRMSGAELRGLTESLGLSVAFLAKRWNATRDDAVSEGRVKNWMKGSHGLPPWVAADVWAIADDTEDKLDALIAVLRPGAELPTYRSDAEYREHMDQAAIYSASWHRMLCVRAAAEVDDVRLVWAVPPGFHIERVRDDG